MVGCAEGVARAATVSAALTRLEMHLAAQRSGLDRTRNNPSVYDRRRATRVVKVHVGEREREREGVARRYDGNTRAVPGVPPHKS